MPALKSMLSKSDDTRPTGNAEVLAMLRGMQRRGVAMTIERLN